MKRQLGLVLLGALLTAAVLLGITITRPSPAPTGVQVLSLWGSVEMSRFKAHQVDALAKHTFDRPVTVIGAEGYAELLLLNKLGLGNIEANTVLSAAPSWSVPLGFFSIGTMIAATSVNIEGSSAIVGMGQPRIFDRMMFPVGLGIEFDANETVYLHALDINNMGNPQRGWHGARVYYVFR